MSGRPALVILRTLGLGDLLTAVPAFRALADAFSDHRRVLAAPASLRPLALATGAVDQVVDVAPLTPLPASTPQPRVAVNLHGRGPQSHRVLLAIGPHQLIAFRHPEVPETSGSPDWNDDEHEVDRWCRLLRESGIPADPRRLRLEPPPGPVPEAAAGATLIHPGAASAARRWPAERWAEVARRERARGRRVVVTGGDAEGALAARVAAMAAIPRECVLAGSLDPGGLARVVAAAARVTCGDTGVAHVATAVGTPSVVLFGPTPPERWGPPAGGPHVTLWKGSTGDPHGRVPHEGLLRIGVGEVVQALDALPDKPAALSA
jgi:ADP-heptose:LPS heptosyltransferase